MIILKMSLSSGILILVITMIRCTLLNRLPKKTFLFLWSIALFRLLVPLSIPSQFSIYTMANGLRRNSAAFPETVQPVNTAGITVLANTAHGQKIFFVLPPVIIIWLLGMSACALFFLFTHIHNLRTYKAALPIEHPFIDDWKQAHPILRKVEIRQSDQINTALTYGLFRPTILLPKTTDWADITSLRFILTHEYIHIRRFDILLKWLFFIAACMHWFNPLVWMMYVLVNRDIELSCDETLVRIFGEATRSSYALTLIKLAEKKFSVPTFVNYFSRDAMEERTISIMKTKKRSFTRMIAALVIIAAIAALFATDSHPMSTDNCTYASDHPGGASPLTEDHATDYVTSQKTMHLENGKMSACDADNGEMLILKSGNTDWMLERGETVHFTIDIENILIDGQTVVIGYQNGDTDTDMFHGKIKDHQTISFSIPETGAYSFYLIGASSDTIHIRSLSIE